MLHFVIPYIQREISPSKKIQMMKTCKQVRKGKNHIYIYRIAKGN